MSFTIFFNEKFPFLGYKNKKIKKSKNWHLFKGVNPCFWSTEMAIFPTFFLGNTGQENAFYDILEQTNAFLGYKNKKFKQSKNWRFSKGFNPWYWFKNGHVSDFSS